MRQLGISGVAGAEERVARTPSNEEVWPLQLIEFADEEQFLILYQLLHKLPTLIRHYLNEHVFPPTMRHQGLKLSVSGQALGGELLFKQRMGFSGTPSDLLPVELGKCHYEQGSDGKVLHTLTDPAVASYRCVGATWTPASLLDLLLTGEYHALIDTGALITAMSNYQVARYLLERGLPLDGVVFLDSRSFPTTV